MGTATIFGYVWVIISGIAGSFLLSNFLGEKTGISLAVPWLQLLPPLSLYTFLWDMAEYAFQASYDNVAGMGMSDIVWKWNADGMRESARFCRTQCVSNYYGQIMLILFFEWIAFMAI